MKATLLLTALLLAAAAQAQVQAQTVWRCGADGRSYSDSPCPEGRAVVVEDSRSAADVQAARDVAGRDQALARAMVAERHQRDREARAAGSGLAGIQSAPKPEFKPKVAKAEKAAPKKPKAAKKHPPAADGTWRAVALATR
jgi:hypothetical protein